MSALTHTQHFLHKHVEVKSKLVLFCFSFSTIFKQLRKSLNVLSICVEAEWSIAKDLSTVPVSVTHHQSGCDNQVTPSVEGLPHESPLLRYHSVVVK